MKAIVLDDHSVSADFFPFTLTRSVADIRIGILTIREKWTRLYDFTIAAADDTAAYPVIPANTLPDAALVAALISNNASAIGKALGKSVQINNAQDLVAKNETALLRDFTAITRGRQSAIIPESVQTIARHNIFLEEGAQVDYCVLNASTGPIYIGKDAVVMEGSMIRGPFCLGQGSVVKMGSRIYGATSTGPACTIGGEIKNSIFFGYSNKAHDGYLGDSVIGEFCNLGAGTTNSNIKNSAAAVSTWNEERKKRNSPVQKAGMLMGDYSRTAIQTAVNTGTVVGISCNVFGEGLTPDWIPSFSWGYSPLQRYELDKAVEHIRNWKRLKGQTLEVTEMQALHTIFQQQNSLS